MIALGFVCWRDRQVVALASRGNVQVITLIRAFTEFSLQKGKV